MNNTMEYKGYVGTVEFSEQDNIFYGKVIGIKSMISYEGSTATELVDDFHGAVDDYFEMCKSEGITPEVAYKGSFNVRLSPELHKQIALLALEKNVSLNFFVANALQKAAQG